MLLKIAIIVILIVINVFAFIQDETKNNIATIRRNEERINELNREIENLINLKSK